MKENKLDSRTKDEIKEKEQIVESDVPGAKFQQTQQVQKPIEQGMTAEVKENPFTAKKEASSGSQLKQEAVAKVITGTGGSMPAEGVASPSRAGLRTLEYSGNEGTILGNPSGTPVVGSPSRSDTRPGQKLDAVAKAIDFIASEQVYQDVVGSKPLQDNPNEVQGFLGHPENNNARLQKIAEAVPGALMYARSCDENIRDEIAFVEGQHVKQDGIDAKVNPTRTFVPDESFKDYGTYYKPYNNPRGNYIPKTMHIGVASDGTIHSMSFDVDDVTVSRGADIVNKSSSAYIRSANIDEINRQNMEAKAGIETESNWCPIVRAVDQPTQTVGELTDDEITTGSELLMSYRFANKAHSYFFNKAAKDGQTPYRSFKEMLKGSAVEVRSSSEYDSSMYNFDAADYVNGAPSLMIALYDSIAKYSKRGDLLTQPRSWKMHLQTADNNINPFKVHPTLAKYIKGRDVFSTIDRSYDPLLPVNISDNWRLSHVKNFNKLLNFAKATVFEVQLSGKGLATAGTQFNNVYDALVAKDHTINCQLQKFSSGSASGHSIYADYGYVNSLRYDDENVIICVGDKDGFATQIEGREAAIAALDGIVNKGNNAQLKPAVILYKVKDEIDDVYAICRYPNIINLSDSSVKAKLFISYDSTTDYMSSDTSKNMYIVRTETVENDLFVYKYQNRQNPYIVTVRNPLLFGIKEWATNLGAKLANPSITSGATAASSLRDEQGILWYHIPIIHSTTNISLWDLIVCASVPFMQKIRTNTQFDTLNYEDNNGSYPYAQLVSIKDANPLACDNYQIVDRLKPLVVGTMKPATAITWIMPEKFWRISHTVSTGNIATETFVLPFYFSHEGFANKPDAATTTRFDRLEDGNVMNFPSTRAGARSAFVDHFYDMTERDIRLCLDMMIEAPRKDNINYAPESEGVYRYGLSNSGVPVITYYNNNNGSLDVISYIKTPRELGLGLVAPVGYNSPCNSKYYANKRVKFTDYSDSTTLVSLGSSYLVRTWKVEGGQYRSLHAGSNLIVNRGGNFAQDWTKRADAIYAHADNTTTESYGKLNSAANIGISLNFNDAMEVDSGEIKGQDGYSTFKPYTYNGNSSNTSLPKLITLQNVLWPRIQILPFALSPFDQTPEGRDNSGTEATYDMTADPYDFMYIFGFAGYKASDYREDVYNRITMKDTLGWTFTSDPFVEASPVLK